MSNNRIPYPTESMPNHPIRRRPQQPVRVELPQWQPAHRQDQLNAIRSELEMEGSFLPIHRSDPAEFDDEAL